MGEEGPEKVEVWFSDLGRGSLKVAQGIWLCVN